VYVCYLFGLEEYQLEIVRNNESGRIYGKT